MPERDVVSERTIELTDPRAMRAYAHPVRMALLGLLRNHGPMTASQAAARLRESSGTCSFHFRQLAKYGFCEEAGGGKGREKPWRATATFTTWKSTPSDPDLADAEHHLNLVGRRSATSSRSRAGLRTAARTSRPSGSRPSASATSRCR